MGVLKLSILDEQNKKHYGKHAVDQEGYDAAVIVNIQPDIVRRAAGRGIDAAAEIGKREMIEHVFVVPPAKAVHPVLQDPSEHGAGVFLGQFVAIKMINERKTDQDEQTSASDDDRGSDFFLDKYEPHLEDEQQHKREKIDERSRARIQVHARRDRDEQHTDQITSDIDITVAGFFTKSYQME